jgi:hypothetical protein
MVGANGLQAAQTSKAKLSTRTRPETKSPPNSTIKVMVGVNGLQAAQTSKAKLSTRTLFQTKSLLLKHQLNT